MPTKKCSGDDRFASRRYAADRVLQQVTQTIVERLSPRRIVLFGSRARGDAKADSDYDLMIEMDTQLESTERRRAVRDLFPRGPWSIDFLVYTPDEIKRWRDDVGFVLYDIVREGYTLTTVTEGSPTGATTACLAAAQVVVIPTTIE